MLTIQNYNEMDNHTFIIKTTKEWIVMGIEETPLEYIIVVLPKDNSTGIWALAGSIIFKLDRTATTNLGVSDSRYKLSNNKDNRIQYIPSYNLTLTNFKLEIQIQTALTC